MIGLYYKWWNTYSHIQASPDHHWAYIMLVALLRWTTYVSSIMLLLHTLGPMMLSVFILERCLSYVLCPIKTVIFLKSGLKMAML